MVTDSQNTKCSFSLNMAAVEGEHRVDDEMETKNETSKEDEPQQIALTLESILFFPCFIDVLFIAILATFLFCRCLHALLIFILIYCT